MDPIELAAPFGREQPSERLRESLREAGHEQKRGLVDFLCRNLGIVSRIDHDAKESGGLLSSDRCDALLQTMEKDR